MGSRLESLINSLNTSSSKAAAGTSSASTNPAVASLNSTYSKLMTDLGGAAARSLSPTDRVNFAPAAAESRGRLSQMRAAIGALAPLCTK
jgi:hypothetical protein